MTELEETKAAFYRVSAKNIELAKENERLRAEIARHNDFHEREQQAITELQEELATLRPAAEALKTAVELRLAIYTPENPGDATGVYLPELDADFVIEVDNGDPLAATIKAIQRAAEAVKENGK